MKPRPTRVPQDPNVSDVMRNFLDELDRKIPNDNWTATADPTATDDADNYWSVGSKWLNTSTGHAFVCTDATAGAAVWSQIT